MIITEYNEDWDKDAIRTYYTEQGIQQGIKQGIQQGIQQGQQEKQLSMIKSLLAVKTPIEFIVKATGWSEEQILNLAKVDSNTTE